MPNNSIPNAHVPSTVVQPAEPIQQIGPGSNNTPQKGKPDLPSGTVEKHSHIKWTQPASNPLFGFGKLSSHVFPEEQKFKNIATQAIKEQINNEQVEALLTQEDKKRLVDIIDQHQGSNINEITSLLDKQFDSIDEAISKDKQLGKEAREAYRDELSNFRDELLAILRDEDTEYRNKGKVVAEQKQNTTSEAKDRSQLRRELEKSHTIVANFKEKIEKGLGNVTTKEVVEFKQALHFLKNVSAEDLRNIGIKSDEIETDKSKIDNLVADVEKYYDKAVKEVVQHLEKQIAEEKNEDKKKELIKLKEAFSNPDVEDHSVNKTIAEILNQRKIVNGELVLPNDQEIEDILRRNLFGTVSEKSGIKPEDIHRLLGDKFVQDFLRSQFNNFFKSLEANYRQQVEKQRKEDEERLEKQQEQKAANKTAESNRQNEQERIKAAAAKKAEENRIKEEAKQKSGLALADHPEVMAAVVRNGGNLTYDILRLGFGAEEIWGTSNSTEFCRKALEEMLQNGDMKLEELNQ